MVKFKIKLRQILIMYSTNQLLLLILYVLITSSLNAKTVVKIAEGFLNGTIYKASDGRNFASFRGVPYAEPPIGKLRFKNPVPKKSWDGVRSATKISNKCPQLRGNKDLVGNEDCLQLNVFTPIVNFNSTLEEHTFNGTLLPVMFWVHGGGLHVGSTDVYNPKHLMTKDIVLVQPNYRLGVLGFLSTGNSVAPGNYGLKDKVLALKWVQKNIRIFGGDPKRVTIFGSSSGAASVNHLVLSSATNGLFHQYIIQSGNSLSAWAYRNKTEFQPELIKIAEQVGCPTTNSEIIVECLRETDVEKLIIPIKFKFFDFPLLIWLPTDEPDSEDAFLTDSPKNLIRQNKMKDYPCLIGSDQDEGMIVTLLLYINGTSETIGENFDKGINLTLGMYVNPDGFQKFRQSIKDFYFNGFNNSIDENKLLENFTKFFGDSALVYPNYAEAEKMSKTFKNPIYFYNFGYRGNVNLIFYDRNITRTFGVPHGDDVLYLFAIVPPDLLTVKDKQMTKLILDLWTSFAATGKPTSDHLLDSNMWLPFQHNNSYLQIGNIKNNFDPSVTLENNYLPDRMNFWKTNFPIL